MASVKVSNIVPLNYLDKQVAITIECATSAGTIKLSFPMPDHGSLSANEKAALQRFRALLSEIQGALGPPTP